MQTLVLLHEAAHGAELGASFTELGYRVLSELHDARALHTEVARLAPDIVVVATDTPRADTLGTLEALTTAQPRPVVMFARDANREVIRRAVDCGVAAYVVDGWAPHRLPAIIEAASARFDAYQSVREELADTRTKLEDRKLIDKAKGIVMEQRKFSEDQAYGALRRMAMDQNLSLGEVARRVIAVAELLR